MEANKAPALRVVTNAKQASVRPELGHDELELLRRTICPVCSDDDFQLFVGICNRTGLDPFARQICMALRRRGEGEEKFPTVEITVDGFRIIAERSGTYAGQKPVQWCGTDGVWKDVWLEDKPPSAARVGVMRHGFSEPVYAIAKFDTYAQVYYCFEEGGYRYTAPWQRMADLMIAKCAECLALRKAFPNDLSGLYALEETKGIGMTLDGSFEQADEPPLSAEKTTPAKSNIKDNLPLKGKAAVTNPDPNYNPLDYLDDQEQERINALVDRVVKSGTYKVSRKWAETSLDSHALKFFIAQLDKAEHAATSSNDNDVVTV